MFIFTMDDISCVRSCKKQESNVQLWSIKPRGGKGITYVVSNLERYCVRVILSNDFWWSRKIW